MQTRVAVPGSPALSIKELRATQNIVAFMGFAWSNPSLTALEVGWRWLFGIPFLYVLQNQFQQILVRVPPSTAGLDRLDSQNPWQSSVILANAASLYIPQIFGVLRWLAPVAIVAWAIISGVGRSLVLCRMKRLNTPEASGSNDSFLHHLPGIILAQALWLIAELAFLYLWFRGVSWAAATHLTTTVNPDLLGYLCWLIFISLGLFTAWAFTSWVAGIVPVLQVEEDCSFVASIRRSVRLGKPLSGKLAEINLVMAIVRIALIILAMVFCAAPIPFSDEFGQGTLNNLYVVIAIVYLIANDLFQVVRLKSYQSLRQYYRPVQGGSLEFASDAKVRTYESLQKAFAIRILETDGWWFSDESSLWDFTLESSLDSYYARIRDVYGVDVSDIEGALIWKIFERINNRVQLPNRNRF